MSERGSTQSKLFFARIALDLSMAQAAEKASLSESTVRRLEQLDHWTDVRARRSARKLCKAYQALAAEAGLSAADLSFEALIPEAVVGPAKARVA